MYSEDFVADLALGLGRIPISILHVLSHRVAAV